MIFVVTGVAGSGKTTVGRALAERVGARFVDADDYHPKSSIVKISRGIPLTDDDRLPWLESLADIIAEHLSIDKPLVLACSALKQKYRDVLIRGCQPPAPSLTNVKFIYLKCDIDTIRKRISSRQNHFMPPSLIESQFADLEEPSGGGVVVVDGGMDVDKIVVGIVVQLKVKKVKK